MSQEKPPVLTRRDFLRAAGLAGALLAGCDQQSTLPSTPEPLPPSLDRLLLLADVHLGPGSQERQANHLVAAALQSFVDHQIGQPIDLLLQLGDLIRDVDDRQTNYQNFSANLSTLHQLDIPVIDLLGNHDLWGGELDAIMQVFAQLSLTPHFYGHHQFTHHQIAWLDLLAPPRQHGRLLLDRVDWLQATVDPRQPLLIFTHYGLHPLTLPDNYYFSNHPEATALVNGAQVWRLIRNLPIVAVFSGHIHQFHYFQEGSTHFVSLPSFTENIAGGPDHHPGIYTLLELSDNLLQLRSYSQGRCIHSLSLVPSI